MTMGNKSEQAIGFFEQVIQLDPASNFGNNAFLQLGSGQK